MALFFLPATTHHIEERTQSVLKTAPSLTDTTFHKKGEPLLGITHGDCGAIPLTSKGYIVAYALCDLADVHDLEQYRWQLFYREPTLGPSYAFRYPTALVTIPMHRHLMGLAPGDPGHVDHINGAGLDNRRVNLRLATPSENQQNRHGAQARNRTGYRGVRQTRPGHFMAAVGLGGRLHNLGSYDTALEAAAVACEWRAEHMPFATGCGLVGCREGQGAVHVM